MNLGVIGVGFVGNAVANYMRRHFSVYTYDIDPAKSTHDLVTLLRDCPVVFLCVPTPMTKFGSCDLSIVKNVIEQIEQFGKRTGLHNTVVLKSTVPPGTTDSLQRDHVSVLFNPEFLTEAKADEDFANQDHIIIGRPAHGAATSFVTTVFEIAFGKDVKISQVSAVEAETFKYVANTFLAMKVAFSNEIWQLCQKLGASHETIVDLAKQDKRLGETHWRVPGPDGKFGFGGTCFPKDINALITEMRSRGVDATVLEAIWKKNLQIRPEKDWNQLKGRAVSE